MSKKQSQVIDTNNTPPKYFDSKKKDIIIHTENVLIHTENVLIHSCRDKLS